MIEFLMAKWVEVVFGLLLIGVLLLFAFVGMCAQDLIEKYEDELIAKELNEKEKRKLQKMLPKLPKEEKNDRKK